MTVVIDGEKEMIEPRIILNQENIQDIKHQDIIYWKNNRYESVSGLKFLAVDFLKAMYEMNTLDYTFSQNSIGFSRIGDEVSLRRKNETRWSAEIPIFEGDKWTGFSWFAYSDTITISDMLRLFFEEMPWSGMLSWKIGKRDYE